MKLIRHAPAIDLRYQIVLTDFLYSLSIQTIQVPVLFLSVGVEFSLRGALSNQLNFPPEGNSLSPIKLAVEVINIFLSLNFFKRGPVPCF